MEVDLILERDGQFYPIEIKMRSYLNKTDARGLHSFRETYPRLKVMKGVIIYAGDRCFQLDQDTIALPFNAVMAK